MPIISVLIEISLDAAGYFNNHRNMKNSDAVSALAALAQENRLDVFRLLVQAGPEGMPAGAVAADLKLAPNTLTFHFDRLRDAGLVTVRREGRSMIYAARFEVMNGLLGFLTENCCQGAADACAPAVCKPSRAKRTKAGVS
jgi:DNA-binding transcriptional ArsR family regulator